MVGWDHSVRIERCSEREIVHMKDLRQRRGLTLKIDRTNAPISPHAWESICKPCHVGEKHKENDERKGELSIFDEAYSFVLHVDAPCALGAHDPHTVVSLLGVDAALAIATPNPFARRYFASWLAFFVRVNFPSATVAVGHIP